MTKISSTTQSSNDSKSDIIDTISRKLKLGKNQKTNPVQSNTDVVTIPPTETPDIDNNIIPMIALEKPSSTESTPTPATPEAITEKPVRKKHSNNKWGPWSKWGSCSRSCGGGVKRQSRSCLSKK